MRGQAGGGLRYAACPCGGAQGRGHVQYPVLLLTPLYLVGNWPQRACLQSFSVPSGFFVFCCSRRRLPRYKHCRKESRVPGPHLTATEDGPVGSAVPGLGQLVL